MRFLNSGLCQRGSTSDNKPAVPEMDKMERWFVVHIVHTGQKPRFAVALPTTARLQ